jgi:hypothetical protein
VRFLQARQYRYQSMCSISTSATQQSPQQGVLLAPTALLHTWQPYASLRPAGEQLVCGGCSLPCCYLPPSSMPVEPVQLHCSLSAVGDHLF